MKPSRVVIAAVFAVVLVVVVVVGYSVSRPAQPKFSSVTVDIS